ncbi:PEP-CTERM sorting domain-containing protein [Nostoc sp. B(2019)]|nr:PEP-CTERM sorting domain-containing protein [Nostoc sp. B(2019)]
MAQQNNINFGIAFGVGVAVASTLLASPSQAASLVGTPSPSLSPTFGTLINFDDKATGTLVSSSDYIAQGVTSITELEGLGTFARYDSFQSQPNYIGTGASGERGTDASLGWDGTIQFKFTNLVNQVGIGIANSQGGPEILSIYDSNYNLLESFTAPDGENTYAGFSRASRDIKYFEIKGDFFAVDDLQFQSVPEPSTIIGTLIALGFSAGFKRKLYSRRA